MQFPGVDLSSFKPLLGSSTTCGWEDNMESYPDGLDSEECRQTLEDK
jgi:hypothetical protein